MTQESTEKRAEPVIARLARLAHADIPPDEFFQAFVGLVRAGLSAEAGSIWIYNGETRQMAAKVKAAPETGPLAVAPDDILSKIAYQTIEQKRPVLYWGEEEESDSALKNTCVMAVPVEIDQTTWVIVLLGREAGEGRMFAREDVHALQSLTVYVTVYFSQLQLRQATALSGRLAKLAEIESDLAGAPEVEKMAYILANRSRELMFFDRVFVALPRGSDLRVTAVSGVDDVQHQGAAVQTLRDLAREASRLGGDWHFTVDYIEKVEDEALRARLAAYFESSNYKSILLSRIEDEGGLLAIIAFERRAAGAYSTSDFQFLQSFCKVSAKALRRARDFQCLPGISLARGAHRLRTSALGPARHRFFLKIAALIAVAAILVFGRMEFLVKGDCELRSRLATFAAPRIDGTVKEILRTEHDVVAKGDVIAVLDDREIQNRIKDVRLRIAESRAKIDRFAGSDVVEWSLEQKSLAILENQLEGLLLDAESVYVTSPQDGVIITPRDEINAALDSVRRRGEPICRVADTTKLFVEVEVAERDVALVRPGQVIRFVLRGHPGQSFEAQVDSLSPSTRPSLGRNVFIARALVDNPDGRFRHGLTGAAKIDAGTRPTGYVIFRSTIDWLRTKFL